jgi:MoaA/NifB/PqqE/SkfB family radical SAM enzyme
MRILNDFPRFLERNLRTLSRGVRLYGGNASFRAWVQLTSYYLRRLAGRAVPLSVCLAITYRCQCNCSNCYATAKARENAREMSTEELKTLIDEVSALGAIHLNITGGEPLLRDDLLDLVAHARARGLITRISTNGWLLTPERVAALRRAGLNQCGIAIDDADPDTHDRQRGVPGLFEKAVQRFRILHEHGIETRFVTYACHRNMPHGMERLMELAKRLRVKTIHLNFPYASGRWAGSFDEMFSSAEIDRLRRFQRFMSTPLVLFEFPTPRALCLAARKSIIYINASGEVTPCPVVPYVIGNVRDVPFATIWKRHAGLLRMDYRGNCPMNEPAGREAFRAHVAAVSSRLLRRG